MIKTQLDRLGNTAFELGEVTCELIDSPMIPLSVFGGLRKKIIAEVEQRLIDRRNRLLADSGAATRIRNSVTANASKDTGEEKSLHVLCRTMEQSVRIPLGKHKAENIEWKI